MESTVLIAIISGIVSLVTIFLKHSYDLKKIKNENHQNKQDTITANSISNDELYAKLTNFLNTKLKEASQQVFQHNPVIRTIIKRSLYKILFSFKFNRVYIIQPHPRSNYEYVSVIWEVVEEGVTNVSDVVYELPIHTYRNVVTKAENSDFFYITDINEQIQDPNVRSKLLLLGTTTLFAQKLVGTHGEWIGTMVAEYLDDHKNLNIKEIEATMKMESLKLKDIIPDIK